MTVRAISVRRGSCVESLDPHSWEYIGAASKATARIRISRFIQLVLPCSILTAYQLPISLQASTPNERGVLPPNRKLRVPRPLICSLSSVRFPRNRPPRGDLQRRVISAMPVIRPDDRSRQAFRTLALPQQGPGVQLGCITPWSVHRHYERFVSPRAGQPSVPRSWHGARGSNTKPMPQSSAPGRPQRTSEDPTR